jgi:hypothetical protein
MTLEEAIIEPVSKTDQGFYVLRIGSAPRNEETD